LARQLILAWKTFASIFISLNDVLFLS